jgi:hypothetical protein
MPEISELTTEEENTYLWTRVHELEDKVFDLKKELESVYKKLEEKK